MSDTILRIIPGMPTFTPPRSAQERALSTLRQAFPEADEIHIHDSEEIDFMDAGENFESVSCPSCEAQLDIGWWQDAMDHAFSSGFRDLSLVTPCCNGSTSLHDLRYYMPQGFARFALEVLNPRVDIPDSVLTQLRSSLDCELRVIWARY